MSRNGFTLIELVVVILIIGLLAAITLPAIQSARESARSAQCKARQKEVGVALHNFESLRKRFPSVELPWTVECLPHLDAAAWSGRFRLEIDVTLSPNLELGQNMLPIFLCPTSPVEQVLPNRWAPTHWTLSSEVNGRSVAQITDGTSSTVAAFEFALAQEAWIHPPVFFLNIEDVKGSRHATLHVLLCDGAVRSISKHVDTNVLTAIATARGNEVVGEF